jgi:hypothetical protein
MAGQSSGGAIYFAILGIVTVAFGLADLLVTASGSEFAYGGILEIPGDIFRGGWGGIIVKGCHGEHPDMGCSRVRHLCADHGIDTKLGRRDRTMVQHTPWLY